MMRVLIIDDEKLARDIVKAYLKPHSEFDLIGECQNGFEGVKVIHEEKPDVVFLDIQMPKLTGFEMLELLDEPPIIVFSTAYDEFAIKAFENNAADYLLKPYSQDRFDSAMEKVVEKLHNRSDNHREVISNLVDEHRNAIDELDRIVIRLGSKIVILDLDTIDYFEAQDDYVAIHSQEQKYLKQVRMKFLESALPQDKFIRVHRSYIVAVNQIDKIEAYSKDSYQALLKTGVKVPISRTGYHALKEGLGF
ncbi:MAG: LytTR family transcriptional regulator DNA-binding domain-containing protein [Bacteroidota bacterium]